MSDKIKTPPRLQDEVIIQVLHSATGYELSIASQRIMLADHAGMPLAQPIRVPLDYLPALFALHLAIGQCVAGMFAEQGQTRQVQSQEESLLVAPARA